MSEYIDVAFLDSGTGGIPYMLSLKQKCPELKTLYLGDTAHFPYGQKTSQEVTECASDVIGRMIEKWNPQTIVIACNTISVTALDQLRLRFPQVPFVGTVPAIRLASRVTKNKNLGLLATNATVNHPYSKKLCQDFAADCNVFSRGDPNLVSFIEHKYFTASTEERLLAVKPAVDYFASKNCDTIILGCTHFTHVASEMKQVAGESVNVIDSREGVSNQVIRVRQEHAAKTTALSNGSLSEIPDMSFFATELRKKEDEQEYRTLCANYNIPFGGLF